MTVKMDWEIREVTMNNIDFTQKQFPAGSMLCYDEQLYIVQNWCDEEPYSSKANCLVLGQTTNTWRPCVLYHHENTTRNEYRVVKRLDAEVITW